MFVKYPKPGEIWEYVPCNEMWHIIQNDSKRRYRVIMRVDGEHRSEYEFNPHRMFLWRKVT